MTNGEAHDKIRELLEQIRDIAKEFGTDDYLTLCVVDGRISFNNDYWKAHIDDGKELEYDEPFPLDEGDDE